jgi:hypothetical protein
MSLPVRAVDERLQFVAHVLPLDGYAQLAAFFDGFMMPG